MYYSRSRQIAKNSKTLTRQEKKFKLANDFTSAILSIRSCNP